jgi:methyl-galactoside transport system ATP-binding protein/inositol transport system ATP-binding protein
MSEYIVQMKNIVREFPGVRALRGVDFDLRPGIVHALMGENGAGKSTLMKCLIGIHMPTEGKIFFHDKEVHIPDTITALRMGISMIHQELSPVLDRTVMENIWIAREPMWGPLGLFVDHKKMYSMTKKLLEELELDLDPREQVRRLTVAKMQMMEIAKAVSFNAEVVIMDEPTSALTPNEVAHLFKVIRSLKAKGVAVVYITHKLEEIFEIADEVTVFRDGSLIVTKPASVMTIDSLISYMVGRKLDEMFPKIECPIGETKLEVRHLSVPSLIEDASFTARRGEILGISGLVGAGRTELMEAIFGLRARSSGEILIDGKVVTIDSPVDAIRQGIGFLTEDRRSTGIVPTTSVKWNAVIAHLDHYIDRIGFINHRKVNSDSNLYRDKLSIKTPSIETIIQNLSGGNQQKVLVARWLLTGPDILILDEPTRGIDVGAKAEIHTIITKLAGEGKTIIMVSSELPEILGMSDRIVVVCEGKITGIVDRKDATQELIMRYATNAASYVSASA